MPGVRAAGMPGRSQAAHRARQPCRLPIVVSRDPIPCPGARARPGRHATACPGAAWPLTAGSPTPLVTATLALGSSALLIARAIGRQAQRKAERRRGPGSTQRRGAPPPDRRGQVASSSSSRAAWPLPSRSPESDWSPRSPAAPGDTDLHRLRGSPRGHLPRQPARPPVGKKTGVTPQCRAAHPRS
jgi:hypothetical protein